MNTRTKRIVMATSAAVLIGISATACSQYNDDRGKGDAPVFQRRGDDSPAYISNMPDGFRNAGAKCLYGFPGMAFVTDTNDQLNVFVYKGCDGKGNPPNTAIGVGN